uniref:Uncharacterized protein n=1 Tax=Molossus molossus TaxID=27622 RepID=A0A7J8FZW3_MOLMO|nr:hypothetical protein HJG59_008238 [Molossus molossus]
MGVFSLLCGNPRTAGLVPIRTLPCSPAIPQQISNFHFPREATEAKFTWFIHVDQSNLICCLVSSFSVLGQMKGAPERSQARPSFGGGKEAGWGVGLFTSGSVLGLPTSPSCLRLVFGRQSATMPGQHQFKPCRESVHLPGLVL